MRKLGALLFVLAIPCAMVAEAAGRTVKECFSINDNCVALCRKYGATASIREGCIKNCGQKAAGCIMQAPAEQSLVRQGTGTTTTPPRVPPSRFRGDSLRATPYLLQRSRQAPVSTPASGAELRMIQLQSMVSQRSQAQSLSGGLTRRLNNGNNPVVKNMGR